MIASPRASGRSYPTPPRNWSDLNEWCRKLAEAVIGIMDGKINATGSVTLTVSSATTTLSDRRIGANSVLLFMAATSNAAAARSGLYVTARDDGSATLNHASNAQTDKTFGYAVLG